MMGEGAHRLKQHQNIESYGTDFYVKQMNRYSPAWTELMTERPRHSDCYGADLMMGEGARGLLVYEPHETEGYGTDCFVKQMDRYSPASIEMIACLRD